MIVVRTLLMTGLVVAADSPSASMVIVSTFGLDDTAFAEVERTWRTWWAAHHEEAGSEPAS